MIGIVTYLGEFRKEILLGLSASILYITYYLLEAVKVPELVCASGEFREFLWSHVPLVRERYWPTPWCVEARLQTVLGSILRTALLPPVTYKREVLKLSDGGQVALDWADVEVKGREGSSLAGGVCVVLPGLTGSARADYARLAVQGAASAGLTPVVFHNRGLGGLPLSSPRLYCALSHDDVAQVVGALRSRMPPEAPLLAVGVSLGGLILGHYLSRAGDRSLVQAALVISSPLDVVKGSESIERPLMNAALSWHMARSLRRTVAAHEELKDLPLPWSKVAAARTLREFDSAFTCNHFGFPNVEEYYRSATLEDKLSDIAAPTFCLCAGDDPMQPLTALPAKQVSRTPRVALLVTARGGHIGFLEGWWPIKRHYLQRITHQYLSAILTRPDLLLPVPKDNAVTP